MIFFIENGYAAHFSCADSVREFATSIASRALAKSALKAVRATSC